MCCRFLVTGYVVVGTTACYVHDLFGTAVWKIGIGLESRRIGILIFHCHIWLPLFGFGGAAGELGRRSFEVSNRRHVNSSAAVIDGLR